jgi:peptide/nickel transport system permease protein
MILIAGRRRLVSAAASRLARFVLTVYLVASAAFVCLYRLPGDPARIILGNQATEETLQRFRDAAGLNQSFMTQYRLFLERSVRLDFGDSLALHRSVTGVIRERLASSMILLAASSVVIVLFSVLLPCLLFFSTCSWILETLDRISTVVGSIPPYVSGVLAVAIFAGWLAWLPALFHKDSFRSWAIASIVLAAYPSAVTFRIFVQEMRQSLDSPYALRARAMGLSRTHLIFIEALPNSFSGALGSLGNGIATFITGGVFVEIIFGIPGIGALTYQAIQNKDLPLISGMCIVFAITIALLTNLIDGLRMAVTREAT